MTWIHTEQTKTDSPEFRQERQVLHTQGKRRCNTCLEILPLEDFYNHKRHTGGKDHRCANCTRTKRRAGTKPATSAEWKQQQEHLHSQGKRRCTRCLEIKELEAFNKLKRGYRGKDPKCRDCHKDIRLTSQKAFWSCKVSDARSAARKQSQTNFRRERDELFKQGQRRCNTCMEVLTLSEFSKDSRGSQGIAGACKQCKSLRWSGQTNIQRRLYDARSVAKQNHLPCDHFTGEELLQSWKDRGISPTHCAYTGVELVKDDPEQPNFLNLEHVQPLSWEGSKGTVLTNLVPACKEFNHYKKSKHFVVALAQWWAMEEHTPKTPSRELLDYFSTHWSHVERDGKPEAMRFCEYLKAFHSQAVV